MAPITMDETLGLRTTATATPQLREDEMATVIVDNEGRVTLPAELREAFGIRPGDELLAVEHDGHLELVTLGQMLTALGDRALEEIANGGGIELRELARRDGISLDASYGA